MPQLVDPTNAEVERCSIEAIEAVDDLIRLHMEMWQLERGDAHRELLSDCPRDEVRGRHVWLRTYIAQGLRLD